MEKKPITGKQMLMAGAFLILVFGVTYYFLSGTGTETEIINTDVISTEPLGQDILILAEKLEQISINSEIFSSNLFQTLVDLSIPISPEAQGRPNPFAAVGSDSTQVITTPKPAR